MDLIKAIIIAIIEGLTEYLPISSTAHMGFAANLMGLEETEFLKMFQVSIQFGAILSVVVAYWKKFFDFKNINLDGVARFGLVWNNMRWYYGASAIFHTYNYKKKQFRTNTIFGSVNVYIGFNFW